MKSKWDQPIILYCISLGISLIAAAQPQVTKPEFRGVWIATVDNIDWPSKPVINSEVQKAEFIRLLEMHKQNKMNALIGAGKTSNRCILSLAPGAMEPVAYRDPGSTTHSIL